MGKNAKKFASSKNISEQTFYDWIRNYKKKAYEKVANISERKRLSSTLTTALQAG